MSTLVKPDIIFDKKLRELYAKAEKDPSAEILTELGAQLSLREFSCEAIDILNKALDKEKTFDRAWYELLFAAGLTEEDFKVLTEKNKKAFPDKKSFTSIRNMALLNHYMGDTDASFNAAMEALDHKDADFTAFEVYAYLHFWGYNFEEALDYVTKSIEANSDNPRSWRLLGHCYFENGEYEKAEMAYKKAIELNEQYVRGWYSLGQLILNTPERYAEGFQCVSRSIGINPFYWNAYFTLINYYLGNKKHMEAKAECLKVISLSGDTRILSEAYNFLGILYYSNREFREALAAFNSALEKKNDSAIAHYYIGQILHKTDEHEKALESFEKAIELDSKFAWPYTQSGFALMELKDYKKAEDYFKQALEVDPDEYWAYMGLADVSRKNRKPKKQLEYMKLAEQMAPHDSDVQNRLAIALECNRKPEEAEDVYLRSLEIDPYNRKAANNLGYLYEKLYNKDKDPKMKEKAIEAWKRRLLICRDTNFSMQGAVNHLLKLDVRQSLIDKWIEIGKLQDF